MKTKENIDIPENCAPESVHKLYKRNHRIYWHAKRTLDVILCAFAALVASPFFLLIMLAIIIDDPHGSPFYMQTRIGRHGVPFKMYKFRTMVVNADQMVADLMDQNEADGPAFKITNDPRITHVGRFLRKFSLDETPQLFNIIKGDMTIVGPRPPLPQEVETYNEFQRLRLMVTPGLTCHWQVSPNKDNVTFDEWMKLDIDYIGERSIWKDLILIFKTIHVVFTGGNH